MWWSHPYHVDEGSDENEDDGEDPHQGAVGARLNYLLRHSLHSSWKQLEQREGEKESDVINLGDGAAHLYQPVHTAISRVLCCNYPLLAVAHWLFHDQSLRALFHRTRYRASSTLRKYQK